MNLEERARTALDDALPSASRFVAEPEVGPRVRQVARRRRLRRRAAFAGTLALVAVVLSGVSVFALGHTDSSTPAAPINSKPTLNPVPATPRPSGLPSSVPTKATPPSAAPSRSTPWDASGRSGPSASDQPSQSVQASIDTTPSRVAASEGVTVQSLGTAWPTDALASVRLQVNADTVMSLTCGCGTSAPDPYGYYPVTSTDSGHSWRVAGPLFGRGGGAHGGWFADELTLLPNGGVLAWGSGANAVQVTQSVGSNWYTASFPSAVTAITVSGSQVIVQTDGAGSNPSRYTSNDDGQTWSPQQ
jgi:hypothetical protein